MVVLEKCDSILILPVCFSTDQGSAFRFDVKEMHNLTEQKWAKAGLKVCAENDRYKCVYCPDVLLLLGCTSDHSVAQTVKFCWLAYYTWVCK